MSLKDTLFIGLDAGGSKTAMVACMGDGAMLHEMTGPGVNLQRTSPDEAAAILSEFVRAARERAASSMAVFLCAGIAGAGREEEANMLATRLRSMFSSISRFNVRIVHDGIIALEGAFSGESGAILIAGTGSIVLVRERDGGFARAGGWGYLIGDEGSGHAIGAAGVRAVAAELDGGAVTALRGILAEAFNLSTRDEIIRSIYQDRLPLHTFAPSVVRAAEEGDSVAAHIVVSQTEALAAQLSAAAGLAADVTPRVSFIGGLTASPYYRSTLESAIGALLPDWQVVEPFEPPVRGALRLARSLAVSP